MLDPLFGLLMQLLFIVVYAFHLSLEALHALYHGVERGYGGGGVLAGERGVGGRFEGGEDGFFFFLDVLLDGLEVSAGDFVGEAEEGLVLQGEDGE